MKYNFININSLGLFFSSLFSRAHDIKANITILWVIVSTKLNIRTLLSVPMIKECLSVKNVIQNIETIIENIDEIVENTIEIIDTIENQEQDTTEIINQEQDTTEIINQGHDTTEIINQGHDSIENINQKHDTIENPKTITNNENTTFFPLSTTINQEYVCCFPFMRNVKTIFK